MADWKEAKKIKQEQLAGRPQYASADVFVCEWYVLQKTFPLLPGGSFTSLLAKGVLSLKMHQMNKKKRLKSNFTTAKVHTHKKLTEFPPSPKHFSLSMGCSRSCSYENDYTTATTTNALLVRFTWHACGCLLGEYLHAHTFIYMHLTVLFLHLFYIYCFVRSSNALLCTGLSVCIAFCLGCIIRLFQMCNNRQLPLVSGWIDILIDFCIIRIV